jgi:type I restriction enzyme, S subunit
MNYSILALGELTKIRTGKLDANASNENGAYPFFTCAVKPLSINTAAFDCKAVLVAGNGDLNVKYYEGKFNAYQRTYIIECLDESKLHPKYLYLFLDKYVAKLREQAIGGVIKYIKLGNLTDAKIPLPPLDEQMRIADILDKAAAIKAKREQVIAKLDELKQSTFESMFGDPIINQNEYPTKLLSELCIRIQIGPFGSQLHEKDYIENGIPVINPTHIKNGEIKPAASLTISTQKHRELSQYHLAQDDLIVGRRGEMGRCAVVKKEQAGWMCGTGSLFLQLDKTQVNALYLQNIMSSQSMRKHLESVAQGVTMANLNKDIVGGLSIQVPPLVKQQLFNEITKYAETVLSLFEESLAKIEITISSLQNQAFTTGFTE